MILLLLGCSDFGLIGSKSDPAAGEDSDETVVEPVDTGIVDTDVVVVDTDLPVDEGDTDVVDTDPPANCDRILIYSTEAVLGSGRYLTWFDGYPTDPDLAGYDIEVAEQADDGPLTAAMLVDRTQLWVLGTWRERGTGFDVTQVAAVRDFVAAGNGLLLASEQDDGTYDYTDDVNGLANLYGVQFSGTHAESRDGDSVPLGSPTGPLVTGVKSVPGFASTPYLTITDPAVEVAFTLGGVDAVAWRDDGVRVVFDRSWGGYRDMFRPYADESTYIQNVADFLETCP